MLLPLTCYVTTFYIYHIFKRRNLHSANRFMAWFPAILRPYCTCYILAIYCLYSNYSFYSNFLTATFIARVVASKNSAVLRFSKTLSSTYPKSSRLQLVNNFTEISRFLCQLMVIDWPLPCLLSELLFIQIAFQFVLLKSS